MTILAIVAGGTWTVWTFFIQRTDVENVSLGVTTDSVEYRGDLRLLVIHVKPKNIGKVLVDPPIFRLTVRRIPLDLPQWKAIDLTPIEPMPPIDLLRHDREGYEMEPGVEYDDIELIVVPKNIVVHVQAELGFSDGSMVLAQTVRAIK